MTDKITTHVTDAEGNLIQQYKEATKLKTLLGALNVQVQDLEDALHSLIEGRWIENASGQVLDDFGEIIGQERMGFDDDFYKILLYVKMGENVSQGETERVIDVYKIITRATLVQLSEVFPAGIELMSNGTINPITAEFIWDKIQRVRAAGVRIDLIGHFDAKPFGFSKAPGAAGFNQGKLGYFYKTNKKFAFSGNANAGGFGTLADRIIGGRLGTA